MPLITSIISGALQLLIIIPSITSAIAVVYFIFLCIENTGGEIYSMQNVWIWAAAEVITIAGMVRQMTDLMKKSGGNVDEINAGTAV